MRGIAYPPETVARARDLRARGLLLREVAAEVGASLKTVSQWCTDPDGAKLRARKDSYAGECDVCGGPTCGGYGPGRAPTACLDCLTWTPEAILEAIRDWADEHGGVPPRMVDARHSGGRLPTEGSVIRRFGTWNAGLLAAGCDLHTDRRPETQRAIEAAVLAGESTSEIAARFGVTREAIHRRFVDRGTTLGEFRRRHA